MEGTKMIRSRFSLLGVLVAAIGLMAISASSAQAEGRWLVLTGVGSNLFTDAEIEANKEKLTGEIENGTAALLTEVLGLKIDILCTAGELIDALLGAGGTVKAGARVKFTGCKVLSGGTNGLLKEEAKCKPHTAGAAVGTIETEPGHAALKLHKLADGTLHDTALILPDNVAERFVAIEMAEGCSLPETTEIFGLFSVWDCVSNSAWLTHNTVHLITEFKPLTHLWVISDTTEHLNTSIDGSANIRLASGRSFAGSPQ
jgi:hypothetical protein